MSVAVEGGKFQREVRLGLVLYGGVSLAIYINGTTNELFRAVRGRGVYYLLKHLLNADITVDVASGASAGGINGMFLSLALANDREFGTCAELWRGDGALDSLLRRLDDDQGTSVLDSQHYLEILENGFRKVWESKLSGEREEPSETRELDLFIAGTDFYGQIDHSLDSSGKVIDTKQHGKVFWLKHRLRNISKCQLDPRRDAYGKWPGAKPVPPSEGPSGRAPGEPERPLEPDVGLLALAKLAQITSCFPGAFAPVHVVTKKPLESTPTSEADQRLKVWGRLNESERYFVDGGVLDNKPFTTTLDAIFHRPAHRRVCRHLLYLEPDPERFADPKAPPLEPTFLSTVVGALSSIPGYESIANDLGRVGEHNASIERFSNLVQALVKSGATTDAPMSGPYLTARLLGIAQRVEEKLAEGLNGNIPEEALERLLKSLHREMLPKEQEKQKAQADSGYVDLLEAGSASASADHAWLNAIDVDFHIRRVFTLTYELEAKLEGQKPEVAANYRALWQNVNNELERLEMIRGVLERAVMPKSFWTGDFLNKENSASEIWDEIKCRVLTLLDADGIEWMPAKLLTYVRAGVTREQRASELRLKDYRREEFGAELQRRLEYVQSLDRGGLKQSIARSLLAVSEERLQAIVDHSDCPGMDYKEFNERFLREDALRFPLELASGVHQRDQISVFRFSPVDAQKGLSARTFEKKICGESFGHFGAFLKRSWRSNDILWGRLDGICRLVEVLLLHTKFITSEGEVSKLHDLQYAELLGVLSEGKRPRAALGELFPALECRLKDHPGCEDPLDKLLAVLEHGGNSASDRTQLVQLLIEVAQLDALCEDVPKVIADAAQEQLEWQELKSGAQLAREPVTDKQTDKQAQPAEQPVREQRTFWQWLLPRPVDSELEGASKDAKARKKEAETARRKAREEYRNALKAEAAADRACKRVRDLAARSTSAPSLEFVAHTWQFRPSGATLNASLVSLATAVFAKQALKDMNVAALRKYFETTYAVGGESATTALPATTLVDLAARAAVLTERALIASGKIGRTLGDKALYRAFIRGPVLAIAGFAAFARRSPESRVTFLLWLLFYALLAAIANSLYGDGLYGDDGLKRTVAIWAFFVLPLAGGAVAFAYWRLIRQKPLLTCSLVWKFVWGLALAAIACVAIGLNCRPSLDEYAELVHPAAPAESPIKVQFAGVTNLVFSDGQTAWMTDGFFTRPEISDLALLRIKPHEAAIKRGLSQLGITQLAAVVPLHTHFDHALDSAQVAVLTGAKLIGSESALNLGRGAGLKPNQLQKAFPGSTVEIGQWQVTFIESRHEPQPWPIDLAGHIDEELKPPQRAWAWRVGQLWSLVVTHKQFPQSFLVAASAGFEVDSLKQYSVDTAFVGIAGLAGQSSEYRDQWWNENVRKVYAKKVVLMHWDDFSYPLEEPLRALPYLIDNVGATIDELKSFARQGNKQVYLPPLFVPFAP